MLTPGITAIPRTAMNGFSDLVTLLFFQDPPPQKIVALLIYKVIGRAKSFYIILAGGLVSSQLKSCLFSTRQHFNHQSFRISSKHLGVEHSNVQKSQMSLVFSRGSIVNNMKSTGTRLALPSGPWYSKTEILKSKLLLTLHI